MLPAAPVEDLVAQYGTGWPTDVPGLWSFLLAPTPEGSAEFARQHLDRFNRLVAPGWHLAVHARRVGPPDASHWQADADLHRPIAAWRRYFEARGREYPDFGAVLTPAVAEPGQGPCLILPIGPKTMANPDLCDHYFGLLNGAVQQAFVTLTLNPGLPVLPDRFGALIQEIERAVTAVGGRPVPIDHPRSSPRSSMDATFFDAAGDLIKGLLSD